MSTDDYLHEKLTADCMRKHGRLVEREYPHAFRAPAADYSEEEAARQEADAIKNLFQP